MYWILARELGRTRHEEKENKNNKRREDRIHFWDVRVRDDVINVLVSDVEG